MVLGADAQTDGPVYDFRIGRYEIRNDQFIEFLNDAILNLDNERGQYMYFDVDSGNVYIHVSAMGTVGTEGSGTLLFSPAVGGRITYTEDAYRLVNPAYTAHPVVGVTWFGATKFCNWLTLQRGMPPSERVYAEGPSAEAWHAETFDPALSATNLNGFRLPMDDGAATASPYNEWYKAASRKSGANGFGSVFGFGRGTLTSVDANYLSSGDPYEIGTTPVGFFDGINKLANNTTLTNNTGNGYGLYDLCGNAAEWVHDTANVSGTIQGATRGGHFTHPVGFAQLRTDVRESLPAASALSFIGF
ncbi:MAG: SUMF1/EgtB/PvdO family nonheme iron enzyme, partial [Phycisphaerales bacterium]|nr:SUMF1/EgtB/PvdO family nonheme iron enzyme [Phycisphaerales bacterium]